MFYSLDSKGCVTGSDWCFFLEIPNGYPENALALAPAKGKTGKKAVFSTALWRWETTTYYNRAYWKYIFFSNCSSDGLHDWGFLLVISLEFQEKSINRFLWCSHKNCSVMKTAHGKQKKYLSSICYRYIVETKTITHHNGAQYINHPIYQSYCMARHIVSPVSESNRIEGAACSFLTEYIPPNHASPWSARQERVASCTVKHILIRKIL